MISQPHLKGSALVLGVTCASLTGPVGPYESDAAGDFDSEARAQLAEGCTD
ncbi:hypothetical protein ACFU98_36690 [Streptomyces sp. NPDC057575]|uniref:hypothetical protein n=1 Tax=unclassified Streptomyces TaxID=2593676 RepID=UPI00368DB828